MHSCIFYQLASTFVILGIISLSSRICGCPSLLCEPTISSISFIYFPKHMLDICRWTASWFLIQRLLVTFHSLISLKSMFLILFKTGWFPVLGSPGSIVLLIRQQLAHEQTLACAHHMSSHTLQQLTIYWLLFNPQVKLTQSKQDMQRTSGLCRIFDERELP